jgi:hypothetical protein
MAPWQPFNGFAGRQLVILAQAGIWMPAFAGTTEDRTVLWKGEAVIRENGETKSRLSP